MPSIFAEAGRQYRRLAASGTAGVTAVQARKWQPLIEVAPTPPGFADLPVISVSKKAATESLRVRKTAGPGIRCNRDFQSRCVMCEMGDRATSQFLRLVRSASRARLTLSRLLNPELPRVLS